MEIARADMSQAEYYENYVAACLADGLEYYELAKDAPKDFLQRLIEHAQGKSLPEGWVSCVTFFCIHDDEILGSIRVRLESNPFIENEIGHIGYDTKPSSRGLGVARSLLKFVKSNVLSGSAYIICDLDNLASRQVIESCGGVLDYGYSMQSGNKTRLRYTLTAK